MEFLRLFRKTLVVSIADAISSDEGSLKTWPRDRQEVTHTPDPSAGQSPTYLL